MKLTPKNWEKFQHYKHRSPPWIKLHRDILDDYDWWCLPIASRALAPMLWLLASCEEDGEFDATPEKLAFRFRMSEKDISQALKPLIDKGYFVCASDMLADCLQDATSEKIRERVNIEKEKENIFIPPIDSNLLKQWISVRKKKKAVEISELVWNSIVKESQLAGITVEQAIEECIVRSWITFKADWYSKPSRANQRQSDMEWFVGKDVGLEVLPEKEVK